MTKRTIKCDNCKKLATHNIQSIYNHYIIDDKGDYILDNPSDPLYAGENYHVCDEHYDEDFN